MTTFLSEPQYVQLIANMRALVCRMSSDYRDVLCCFYHPYVTAGEMWQAGKRTYKGLGKPLPL